MKESLTESIKYLLLLLHTSESEIQIHDTIAIVNQCASPLVNLDLRLFSWH